MWRHGIVVSCLFTCQALAQEGSEYEKALARYKECESRAPFLYHTEGRARLAATRSVEALKILAEDYGKTKNYTEYARYTLAQLFGMNFQSDEAVPLLEKLREGNGKLPTPGFG